LIRLQFTSHTHTQHNFGNTAQENHDITKQHYHTHTCVNKNVATATAEMACSDVQSTSWSL